MSSVIRTGLHRPEDYILALVEDGSARESSYVCQPFENEPDFHVYSVNYDLKEPLDRSGSQADPPTS